MTTSEAPSRSKVRPCRFCGHTPLAPNARECPNCHGQDPVRHFVVGGVALALFGLILLGLILALVISAL